MPELELPPEVEEYRLIRLLGSGAMGRVYLAEDRLLDRLVAIKFIAATSPSPAVRQRFFTEARAAARITHSNVVAVYRVAEFRRQPFLVAEYVRGQSLAELTRPMASSQLVKIANDLARGLAAAHRRGVLHRDIKPANAMISEDGVTKLLDFGLAELVNDSGVAEKARLAGTPIYMAPELWTGSDPSPRSDIFALGILLFELYCGAHPFDRKHGNKAEDRGALLETLVDDPDRAFCKIVERCIATDPLLRYGSADAFVDALDGLAAVERRAPRKIEGSPYRGLLAFEAEHRDLFFGRRSEALAIRERLRSERLVVVAGDSGTGKSSLCRAGVLPLLQTDFDVVHLALGRAPLLALTVALAPLVGQTDSLTLEHLTEAPADVARSLRGRDRELLVFIDQLEELVTQASRADAELVSEILQVLVLSHGIRVLATARSDFLTRLAALRGLGDDLASSLSLLRPLSEERLFEVVVEPAAAVGVSFESEKMVEQLIEQARVSDGGLPLLQFALGQLWEGRDPTRGLISEAALAEIGGVAGALARHADEVIAALPSTDRTATRAVFLSLVTSEGTRAHRDHDELVSLASRHTSRGAMVVEALVKGRLLVAHEAETGRQTAYAIAHEALLAGWHTLRAWMTDDVEGRAANQRIERAAAEWDRLGRRPDLLWHNRQLLEASKANDAELGPRELDFLRANRRRARSRRMRAWLAVVTISALIVGGVLVQHVRRSARRMELVAIARGMVATASIEKIRYSALRATAFERFDRGDSDAEHAWSAALANAGPADSAFANSEQQLEQVLQDSPDDTDANELLAHVLRERAELAEIAGHLEQRNDLLRRAELYAPQGNEALAHIQLSVTEPRASITLRRYAEHDGKLVASTPVPWTGAPLASGSILFDVSVPGRETIHTPVLVHRGETLKLAIEAPDVDMPGFTFIPAGSFLYGSGGDEALRPMYISEPMHSIVAPAFWISTSETTYGEWIEYLRSLPPADRARRFPNTNRQGFIVRLAENQGVYALTLGNEKHLYSAREGVLLHYDGRESHSDQNWSRLPVTGVSYDDAVEYTAWLRKTGRVPHARLCTEWEWEHATRGADGRIYPTGDQLDPSEANVDLTYGRVLTAFGPDEVGTHRESDSVYGVHDLAGNVWEFTSSHSDTNKPIVRGGCFFQVDIVARAMNRQPDLRDLRDAYYGIRVCAPFEKKGWVSHESN